MANRREFIVQLSLGGSTAMIGNHAFAQGAMVADSDPQAAALGYRVDSSAVDRTKFPKHVADQQCGVCSLYLGKAGDATGGCPLFAGKQVTAEGWCSAWAKKT